MILRGGEFYCFQCAILQSVSAFEAPAEGGGGEAGPDRERKGRRGPFSYFAVVAAALTLVMWAVVFFGGLAPPPGREAFLSDDRLLFFMADSAIKRYARYEGHGYPERLADLVPDYLPLQEHEMFCLEKLAYQRYQDRGYRLALIGLQRVRARVK